MPDDTTRPGAAPTAVEPAIAVEPAAAGDLRSLRHLAFERNDDAAFEQWQALDPRTQREVLLDRYIFVAVLSAAARRLGTTGTDSPARVLAFADRIQRLLAGLREEMAARQQPFGLEWFEGLERWAGALLARNQFDRADQTLQIAYATGAQRLAGIHQALRATEALLLATTGRHHEAAQIAVRYALRPYLLPDRRLRPQIYRRLMAALILVGRVAEYRALLWRGLSDVYFDGEARAWFVAQARATYRGHLRTLLRADVPASLRLQYAARVAGDALGRLRIARWLRADRALDFANFALAYYLQYGHAPRRLVGAPDTAAAAADRILVTRAMGGIGDLLMMTPGLRALRRANPQTPIDFAIPRGYHALLEGNPDVQVIDIEAPELDPARYRLWYDLTDCPAARIESRQMPNVRSDRVTIFAAALGIGRPALSDSGFAPRYEIADDEARDAREFVVRLAADGRPLVGIQLRSAESYRDYPQVTDLVAELARDCCVLLFDSQPIAGFDVPQVHKVVLPLRRSFAIAACCDLLIAPDSSFVHLGAALGRRVLAIFGPIDGAVRCRRFPTVSVVAPVPADFPCAPCRRSEYTPCRLTGQRESACLRSIDPRAVADQARRLIRNAE